MWLAIGDKLSLIEFDNVFEAACFLFSGHVSSQERKRDNWKLDK